MANQLKMGHSLGILLVCIFCAGALGAAQEIAKRYFDLNELGDIPGVVQVSTDYLTIIEFEGHSVEEASTARGDLYVLEISDNIIRIRANEEIVNTDLYARVAGKTVLFKLESDATTQSPRRYVVRDVAPPQRGIQRFSGSSGASRPSTPADTEVPLFPKGLLFETDLFRPRQSEVIIQYRLINESEHPIVNDPFRLRVYYGDTSIRYVRTSSPVAGRPNFLAPGEAEYGQIVVPQAPADLSNLELEWQLIEVGPGTQHTLVRNFADMAERPAAALDQVASPAPQPAQTETPPQTDTADAASEELDEPAVAVAPADDEQVGESGDQEGAAASATLVDTSFGDGSSEPWNLTTTEESGAAAAVKAGEHCTTVTRSGEEYWHVSLSHGGLSVDPNHAYALRLDAYADKPVNLSYDLSLAQGPPYTSYFYRNVPLTTSKMTFEHPFTLEGPVDGEVRLVLFMGLVEAVNVAPYTICLDNIQLIDLGAESSLEQEIAEPTPDAAPAREGSEESTGELVSSDFENGVEETWVFYADETAQATGEADEGEFCATVEQGGEEIWETGLLRSNLALEQGNSYTLSFDAYADKVVGIVSDVSFQEPPYTAHHRELQALSATKRSYSYAFDVNDTESESRLIFSMGGVLNAPSLPYTVCLDNIELVDLGPGDGSDASAAPQATDEGAAEPEVARADAAGEQPLVSSGFEQGVEAPWGFFADADADASLEDDGGEACLDITSGGSEVWHVSLGRNDLALERGKTYALRFDGYADRPVGIIPVVGQSDDPYTPYHQGYETLIQSKTSYRYTFEGVDDPGARLIFLVGGAEEAKAEPYRVCLDNIELKEATASPASSLDETTDDVTQAAVSAASVGDAPTSDAPIGNTLGSDAAGSAAQEPDPWFLWTNPSTSAQARREDAGSEVCVTVEDGGEDVAAVIVGQNNLPLEPGSYTLSFDAYSDKDVGMVTLLESQDDPSTDYHHKYETLTPSKRSYTQSFKVPADVPADANVRVAFLIGGKDNTRFKPYKICLDNLEVAGAGATAPVEGGGATDLAASSRGTDQEDRETSSVQTSDEVTATQAGNPGRPLVGKRL